MGIVSDHVRELIAKQVQDNGLVVWFDPDGTYADFAATFTLPDTTIARYDGSFFALRHAIDPLLAGEEAPRLVVYVPQDEEETAYALVELTAATKAVLKPGQNPVQRNTRLSVVAKHALRPRLGDEMAEEIARKADAGMLTLADLDSLAERGGALAGGVLPVIFGSGTGAEMALQFLTNPQYDQAIGEKRATDELARLLGTTFGLDLPADATCDDLRERTIRHILATEFIAHLAVRDAIPAALGSVPIASGMERETCATFARNWRMRRDLAENYAAWADRVEQRLGIAEYSFATGAIADCETFAALEAALQAAVERTLLTPDASTVHSIPAVRLTGFWSGRIPAIQARWALIQTASDVLAQAERVETDLRAPSVNGTDTLFRAYTEGAQPWCLLDTAHRHLERRYYAFDFDEAGEAHSTLNELLNRARQRYTAIAGDLAERFVHALASEKGVPRALPRQTSIYAEHVAPALAAGKTAYVLVDAFRYEMAHELAGSLRGMYDTSLRAAFAAVPTITPVGMAALLPDAERGVRVVSMGDGRVTLAINGTPLKDRKERMLWLQAHATNASSGSHATVAETKLEDLLPLKTRTRAALTAADLIVVTAQEIDEMGETGNTPLARRTMDEMLTQIARAVRMLVGLGCQHVIVAADHGYLFADELDSDMKVDPPGREAADLHRRVWIGHGGAAHPAFFRTSLAAFNAGDALDIAVPWGLGAFKVQGGNSAYFHGGLSPQEVAIPVLTIAAPVTSSAPVAQMSWLLTTGAKKLSTRFFSVTVSGTAQGLLERVAPRVRVELREKKRVFSTPVSASYGFSEGTGDVELRFADAESGTIEPNTVMLMIQPDAEPTQTQVSVHLLDATTERELAALSGIEAAITI